MKLIESKAEYIPQDSGLEGIYKQIELSGRTAYHSEDKITPDSAKGFVDRMIKSHHGACLEHGTVYLRIPVNIYIKNLCDMDMFPEYPWISQNCSGKYWYITTNFRYIIEGDEELQTMMDYLCEPTKYHEKRYTMKFTCSRAIAQELTRHRKFSFLMESQRYINYSKEKHGGEITIIEPSWINDSREFQNNEAYDNAYERFISACEEAEGAYFDFIDEGFTPQQARAVLPNATKTELVVTGFASDWRFLLDLRLFEKTGKVDPDMLNLMQKAQKAMQDAGIWDDIMNKESKFK